MLRTFADGRLFGSRTGDGPPTVLALHGWGRSSRDFDAVLAPADASAPLDAVAIDLPGFGATPAPPSAWGAADYADCVAGVLEEMATPVVVLGHSFGGRVAVHLAAARPEQVRGLVLTGVPLLRLTPRPTPSAAFRLLRALHRRGLVGDRRMEAARRRYGSSDYRNAEGVMRQVHVRSVGETYEDQLDAVVCPVAFVWGDGDTTVPPAVADAAIARIHAAHPGVVTELVRCPGVGHLLPLADPATLRSAVVRMLGPHPAEPGGG